MQLVVVQSYAATFSLVLSAPGRDPLCHRLVLSAYELDALASVEDPDMLALWHIAVGLAEARRHARVAPISQLEEYAFLRANGLDLPLA